MKRIASFVLLFVFCFSFLPVSAFAKTTRDFSFEQELAVDLKALGLFKGVSDTDFDLERAPTRIEALVMLIRVLGKESEVINGIWKHPFTDVPTWADNYVGYAYSKGLTNGVSATKFGTSNANSQMYLTFVLRALGYSDANGLDFTYENPYVLARKSGILPEFVDVNNFLRADVVVVSYAAVAAKMKNGMPLSEKLIADGVFDNSQYIKNYDSAAIGRKSSSTVDTKKELTSKEVFNACSPAIIYIETWDANDKPYALGSGFFITSDGVAVTNYHVLENATFATASLKESKVSYTVTGVLYYDDELDFAVIKTNATNVPYLKVGDSSEVYSGDQIYTIGNPQGLTNTISDGIVSNPRRDDFNGMIQITAPISPGSSGGALLNTRGEVIGITTATLTSGQNLNFAVPINEVVNKSDLPNISTKYNMFTMEEFAALNRHTSAPTVSNGTRQELAFDALKTFIIKNNNYTYSANGDIDAAYNERQNNENGLWEYTIVYDEERDSIIMRETCIINNEMSISYMQLCSDRSTNFCMFSNYAAGNNSNTATFTGTYTLNTKTFTENSVITFETAEGALSKKTYYAGFAKLMNLDMLNFVDYIYYTYLGDTGFSTVDFGFKANRTTSK